MENVYCDEVELALAEAGVAMRLTGDGVMKLENLRTPKQENKTEEQDMWAEFDRSLTEFDNSWSQLSEEQAVTKGAPRSRSVQRQESLSIKDLGPSSSHSHSRNRKAWVSNENNFFSQSEPHLAMKSSGHESMGNSFSCSLTSMSSFFSESQESQQNFACIKNDSSGSNQVDELNNSRRNLVAQRNKGSRTARQTSRRRRESLKHKVECVTITELSSVSSGSSGSSRMKKAMSTSRLKAAYKQASQQSSPRSNELDTSASSRKSSRGQTVPKRKSLSALDAAIDSDDAVASRQPLRRSSRSGLDESQSSRQSRRARSVNVSRKNQRRSSMAGLDDSVRRRGHTLRASSQTRIDDFSRQSQVRRPRRSRLVVDRDRASSSKSGSDSSGHEPRVNFNKRDTSAPRLRRCLTGVVEGPKRTLRRTSMKDEEAELLRHPREHRMVSGDARPVRRSSLGCSENSSLSLHVSNALIKAFKNRQRGKTTEAEQSVPTKGDTAEPQKNNDAVKPTKTIEVTPGIVDRDTAGEPAARSVNPKGHRMVVGDARPVRRSSLGCSENSSLSLDVSNTLNKAFKNWQRGKTMEVEQSMSTKGDTAEPQKNNDAVKPTKTIKVTPGIVDRDTAGEPAARSVNRWNIYKQQIATNSLHIPTDD